MKRLTIIVTLGLLVLTVNGCTTGAPALQRSADMFVNTTVGPEYEALLDMGIMAVKTEHGWTVRTDVDASDPAIAVRKNNVAMFRQAVEAHPPY